MSVELRELLSIRNFQTAAAEVQKARLSAFAALEIFVKTVVHESPFASHFDEVGIFHDFQVMRDVDNFRFQKFRNISHRQFSVAKRIHDPEAMRITQRF